MLDFSKDEKRITLSHTSIWKEGADQPVEAPKKRTGGGGKGKTLNKINQEGEKSTLGDLEALSALKDKMESASKPAKKAAPKKEEKAAEAKADDA